MNSEFISLDGLSALVTGAGSGLGRQMAIGLAEGGAAVAICGRRPQALEETAALASATGADVTVIPADVTSEADLNRLVDRVGRVDILVNNAGTNKLMSWESASMEEWRALMSLNVDAPFRLCQLFAPPMALRGWGRIINIASIYGAMSGDPRNYPGVSWDIPAYVVSKHALIGLTKYLATALAGRGVCVNAISPGMFATEGNEDRLTPEVRAILEAATPMQRLGGSDDLKAVVVFLASRGSAFCTGQNIVVDGGWSLW